MWKNEAFIGILNVFTVQMNKQLKQSGKALSIFQESVFCHILVNMSEVWQVRNIIKPLFKTFLTDFGPY